MNDTDRLSKILKEGRGPTGQTMVSLEGLTFLLNYSNYPSENGNPKEFFPNREVGTCHSHIFNYEGREFFAVTGSAIEYGLQDGKYTLTKLYPKSASVE